MPKVSGMDNDLPSVNSGRKPTIMYCWVKYIFFPFLSERAIIPSISATRLNFRWLLNFMPTDTCTASIKATFTS